MTLLATLAFLAGCGPSAYDLYVQAMQAEQRAAKGGCKLVWDTGAAAHIVNSDKVTACLLDLREAQSLYHRAQDAGSQGKDFSAAVEAIDAQVSKIDSMLRMVSQMEQDKRQAQVEKEVN